MIVLSRYHLSNTLTNFHKGSEDESTPGTRDTIKEIRIKTFPLKKSGDTGTEYLREACELRGLVSLENLGNSGLFCSVMKLILKCLSGHDVYFPKSGFYRISTGCVIDTTHQS